MADFYNQAPKTFRELTLETERDRYREALQKIAAPPFEDDSDALNILQEHWAIAADALKAG
jgi:hypothetical protein